MLKINNLNKKIYKNVKNIINLHIKYKYFFFKDNKSAIVITIPT